MITHGWPGSIVEFHKVIEPLTNPTPTADAPRTPSMSCARRCPGYGFSGKPSRTGWGVEKIAEAWETLMLRLGYDRYGAQGGDWGAAVTTQIGRNRRPLRGNPSEHADRQAHGGSAGQPDRGGEAGHGRAGRSPEVGHRLFQAAVHPAANAGLRAGRFAGGTAGVDRREVLGVDGLRRQPRKRAQPGRAARQRDGVLGDRHRGVLGALVLGELPGLGGGTRVELPTGVAAFPGELLSAPRSWCEPVYNITHWTDMPRGGHFAAFEQPELFVEDLRAFFATVR